MAGSSSAAGSLLLLFPWTWHKGEAGEEDEDEGIFSGLFIYEKTSLSWSDNNACYETKRRDLKQVMDKKMGSNEMELHKKITLPVFSQFNMGRNEYNIHMRQQNRMTMFFLLKWNIFRNFVPFLLWVISIWGFYPFSYRDIDIVRINMWTVCDAITPSVP